MRWGLGTSWPDPDPSPTPDPEAQPFSPIEADTMDIKQTSFSFSCARPTQRLKFHGTDPGGHC